MITDALMKKLILSYLFIFFFFSGEMRLKQQKAKQCTEMLELSSRFEEGATEIRYAVGTQVPSK